MLQHEPTRVGAPPADGLAPGDALLQALWRQRWLVVGVAGACVAAAALYLLVAPRVYLGAARVYVQPAGPRIMGGDKQQLLDPAGQNFLNTQREMMASTPVFLEALAKLEGDRKPKAFEGDVDRFEWLKQHVGVKPGKNDDLLTVYCEARDPKDAADVANAVVGGFMAYHAKQKESTASEVLRILQAERQKTEADLAGKTKEMLEFRRSRGVLSFSDEKGNVNLARLKSVSDALTAAQLETFAAKSAYEEALGSIASDPGKIAQLEEAERGGGTTLGVGEEGQLRLQLVQGRANLNSARQGYGPDHPTVRTYQKAVDSLEVAYVAALGRRHEASQQKEKELAAAYEQQQKDAIARSADAAEYARLEVEVARLDKHLEEVARRIQEIKITETSQVSNVTPVEWASPPRKAYKPKALYTLPVAGVTGLLLGVVVAAVRDWQDPRMRTAEEVKAVLGLPVLGEIPRMDPKLPRPARGRRVLLDPASDVAEACRGLRTAIHYGVRDGGKLRTILVTSPSPEDGKSTVASNLAIAMAQAGRRVLLVDADLRRPTQQEIFELPRDSHGPHLGGLATLLEQGGGGAETGSDEAEKSIWIRKVSVEGPHLLACGPAPERPAELLNGRRFVALLETLAAGYDHVIIDSPPVGAVADARIIGAACDATILVLRADDLNRRRCEAARDALLAVGATVLGVVLNGVRPGSALDSSGYGGYYRKNPRNNESRGDDETPSAGGGGGGGAGNGATNGGGLHAVAAPATLAARAAAAVPAISEDGQGLGQRWTPHLLMEAMRAALRDGRHRLSQRPRRD